MPCDIISRLQHETHELCHVEGVVCKLWMVPEGWMVTLRERDEKGGSRTPRQARGRAGTWEGKGRASYLVLWEHFVHFLPSHISNAPQSSQISIAALVLTVISERDRCTHFTTRSPAQHISQFWLCVPKCSKETHFSHTLIISSTQGGQV